jgi:hypothetical protein
MEVNKGIAAILVAGIVFFLTGLIGDTLVRERLPEKPALIIAAAPAATGGAEAKPAGPAPIAPLLASADPKVGDQARGRAEPLRRCRRAARPRRGFQLFACVGEVQRPALDLRCTE